jgi:hypothetical protein
MQLPAWPHEQIEMLRSTESGRHMVAVTPAGLFVLSLPSLSAAAVPDAAGTGRADGKAARTPRGSKPPAERKAKASTSIDVVGLLRESFAALRWRRVPPCTHDAPKQNADGTPGSQRVTSCFFDVSSVYPRQKPLPLVGMDRTSATFPKLQTLGERFCVICKPIAAVLAGTSSACAVRRSLYLLPHPAVMQHRSPPLHH